MNNHIDLPIYKRGKGVVAFAKVSPRDYDDISQWKWYLHDQGYAFRVWYVDGWQRSVRLHQAIMGKKRGFVIDHRNRDKLDCRRCNLRFATKSQNAHNTARKGVYYCKWRRRFYAHCRVNGTRHSLGGYSTREEAESVVVKFREEMGLAA